jgi:biopolymer transport protein TolR
MGVSLPGGGGGGRGRSQNFDLNLVPFIDLMSTIITFLIATAVWVQISSINIEQAISTPENPPPPPDTPPTPPLTVHVRADGISVFRTPDKSKNLPALSTDQYDWEAVSTAIKAEKEAFPAEGQATIVTQDGVHYKHMIHALDISREHGFDKSLLGGSPAPTAGAPAGSGG